MAVAFHRDPVSVRAQLVVEKDIFSSADLFLEIQTEKKQATRQALKAPRGPYADDLPIWSEKRTGRRYRFVTLPRASRVLMMLSLSPKAGELPGLVESG